jgi:putative hydrolase of the HAD superfamily
MTFFSPAESCNHTGSGQSAQLKVISLDVVGTLLRVRGGVGEVYAEPLHRRGLPADAHVIGQRFGEAFREAVVRRPSQTNEDVERAFWARIVRSSLGEDVPAELFAEVFEEIFAAFASGERWEWIGGAKEALTALRESGYRLCLLSNADQRFHSVLKAKGAADLVERVFLSTEMGWQKPSLEAFGHVFREMACAAEDVLHVGDDPVADDKGARQAGCRSLLIGRDLADVRDLPGLLGVQA